MTYEILLIVVIGGMGSVSGSILASFLFIACSEWWLRFLDAETVLGNFKVPLLAPGFRISVPGTTFLSNGNRCQTAACWPVVPSAPSPRRYFYPVPLPP